MSEVTRAFLTKASIVAGVLCLVALGVYFSDQSCSNPFFVAFNTWCMAPR